MGEPSPADAVTTTTAERQGYQAVQGAVVGSDGCARRRPVADHRWPRVAEPRFRKGGCG